MTKAQQMIPKELLHKDETVQLAIKPSLWLIAFFSFKVVTAAFATALLTTLFGNKLGLAAYSAAVIWSCGGLALGRVAFALLEWASRSYILTDKRVIKVSGVFRVDIFQCELTRVQNTFMALTLPQRILGLGHIAFATAGTGAIEAVWQYCKTPLKIHETITQHLQTKSTQPNHIRDST